MTKNSNRSRSTANRSQNEGRVTKTNEGVASVAPEGTDPVVEAATEAGASDSATEGTVAEQTDELAAMIAENGLDSVLPETAGQPAPEPTEDTPSPDEAAPQEAPAPETTEQPAEAVKADPFADLPMVVLGDYEHRDLTDAPAVSDPRKYEAVHKAAIEGRLPVKKGWKHAGAMIALDIHGKGEFKPSSVNGTIQQIVQSYGRAGVPAAVLVAKVREAQIGNKRSHYCTSLPPIGWAEGWIDTFISKRKGKVLTTAAPLTAEQVAEAQKAEAGAVAKVEEAQQKAA